MWTKFSQLLQDESDLDLHFLSNWLQNIAADDLCCIGALRVDECEFQFIYGHYFQKMYAPLRGLNNLLTMLNLNQITKNT